MVVACFTLFKEAGASKDRRTQMKQESYLKLQRSSQIKKEAIHGLALVLNWESLTLMLIYLQTSSQESEANYLVSNLVSPKAHWKWNMKRCQRRSSKELDANEKVKISWTDIKHGPDWRDNHPSEEKCWWWWWKFCSSTFRIPNSAVIEVMRYQYTIAFVYVRISAQCARK